MDKLVAASKHTDINKIIIDDEKNTVYLEDPEMSIDVGSIGKGYAVEQVCRYVEDKGFKHGLVSVGGNVRAISDKGVNNELWNVGIENPDKESEKKSIHIMQIKDMSLVTSGDYQRYYTVDGVKYHHIINDNTLMPSDYFRAVTILCKDSGYADALSTAVFNMSYEEGSKFISSLDGIEALWIFKNGDIKYSDNFKKYIKE
jgi:thiamine biosynthesis lipoprotein